MTVRARHRRWIRLLALLAAVGVIAAACGGGDDTSAPAEDSGDSTAETDSGEPAEGDDAPAEEDDSGLTAPTDTTAPEEEEGDDAATDELVPQFGGTLRVAVEAEADALNPTNANMANSAYVMVAPVIDNLVYFDENGDWFPFLAESFTPNDDNTAWQMKVREGVLFHDDSTLDADDVIASFESQLADPIVSLAIRYRFPDEGAIEKIDEFTVQYNLARAEAAFPATIGSQLGMVLPSEFVAAAVDDPRLNQMPPGTGPFMITSRTQDEVTVLERFPDYWAADLHDIYLDAIEIFPITDPAIAAERLAAGDLDLVSNSNTDSTLTLRETDGVQVIENLRSGEDLMMLNTEVPPFDDIRARQAITHATDQDAYVALIRQGVAPRADSMFHPDLIWNNPDVVQQTNMPELAGPLVESYCADFPENCSDGRINTELQWSGPSVIQTRIGELLIDSWEDFFNVAEDELLQDEHILQVATGQFNAVTWRQFGEPAPANDTLWINCDVITVISLNWPRFCDEARQALINELVATADLDRRVEIWKEIQVLVRDAYTYVFFNHANWTVGARENVQNICGQTAPDGTVMFCNNQGRVRLRQIWLS